MNRRSITKASGRHLAALAFLSLVLCACSSDEELTAAPSPLPASDTPTQLTFNVHADGYGETRGTPLNNVTGSCGLIGFQYTDWEDDMNANEGEEDSKSYLMYNEVMQGSGEIWKTSKSYVLNDTKKMRFYAYYPYQSDIDSEGGMLYFNDGDNAQTCMYPFFTYTTPENSSDQKDLMFAISTEVEYREVQTGNNTTEKVLDPIELQFHHLLSAVKLTVNNGFDNGTIKSVKLTNIRDRGIFEYESIIIGNDPEWYLEESSIDITQNMEVKVSTKNDNELSLTNETQYFMVLPQEINQSSQLIIVYNNGSKDFTISSTIGQLLFNYPDPDEPSETVQKPLTFEMGKVITININIISLTKMAVKCTLADWNTGAVFGGNNADQKTIDLGWGLADWEDYTGNDPTNGESTEWEIPTGPAMYTQP